MKIVSINHAPEVQRNILAGLQEDLVEVIEEFVKVNPELPAVTILGVLRLVEVNFIDRL